MKCWTITYYVVGKKELYVGAGYGETPDEALEYFFANAYGEDIEDIVDIELYK